ncbi:hypothetical protein Hdeb2414_s0025g00658281 [Helianthus debilis subsp. tardiflorus]
MAGYTKASQATSTHLVLSSTTANALKLSYPISGLVLLPMAFTELGQNRFPMATLHVWGYPLLVMCALFILFTYLNHNYPSVAHYDAREWD